MGGYNGEQQRGQAVERKLTPSRSGRAYRDGAGLAGSRCYAAA